MIPWRRDEVVIEGAVAGPQRAGRSGLLWMALQVEALVVRAALRRRGDRVVGARLDADVVGRIRVDEVDRCPVQQPVQVVFATGIAAQEPVLAEQPEVSGHRDRLRGRLRDLVGIAESFGRVGRRRRAP